MPLNRRLILAAIAAASSSFLPTVQAEEAWPSRPVRWIVPFPAGGAMDALARTLSDKLSRSLGKPFVVENKPGAGGNIGADLVAKAPADGHTIMITSIGMATNKSLYAKLSYDPVKDFEPVSLLAVVPNVLVTNSTQPTVRTLSDVIAAAKAQPGKLTYASAGNGTSIHLAGELFKAMADVDMLHVPYRGSGPALTDLLAGQVNYMWDSITSARPHIESGKLRAIALSTAKRSSSLPNVPTAAESGLSGYDVSPWFAVFAPAGTSSAIVNKLNAAMLAALKLPDVRERLEAIGAEPVGSSPAELAKHLQSETVRWSKLITERNIRAD